MHELRREPATSAKAAIVRVYGTQLAQSPIRIVVVNPTTLQFTERSSTGKTFAVTLRNGHISKQNLKPYGFVF